MTEAGLWNEHPHQAFFLELPDGFVETLVTDVGRPEVGGARPGTAESADSEPARPRTAYRRWPGGARLTRPTTSPGYAPRDGFAIAAEEAVNTKLAKPCRAARLSPPCLLVMLLNAPCDAIAMAGVHVACILNTNPENSGAVGRINPTSLMRAAGLGARVRRAEKGLDAEVVQRAAEDRRLTFLRSTPPDRSASPRRESSRPLQ